MKKTILAVMAAIVLLTGSLSTAYSAVVLSNTNGKMPGGTVTVYESSIPGYYKYINGRYGFSVDFPQTFNLAFLPANGDGAKFASPDGLVELSVYGGHNIGWTIDQYYQMSLKDASGELGYTAKGDDWFVISWKTDGTIYYRKEFFCDAAHNGFTLTYPENQQDAFDDIIANVEKSFIPGWKSGRRI